MSDLFESYRLENPSEDCCDIVIANPPQTPASASTVAGSPNDSFSAGPEGTDTLKRVISTARQVLCPGGELFLVHYGYNVQQEVDKAFLKHSFTYEVIGDPLRFLVPYPALFFAPRDAEAWNQIRALKKRGLTAPGQNIPESDGLAMFSVRLLHARVKTEL